MPIIQVDNLTYMYEDGTLALREMSVNLEQNRKVAILGANGAGKTTLLLHLNGVLRPKSGQVNIDGITVNRKNMDNIRQKIGFVFQDPDDQVFSTTVYQDLAFGLINMGIPEDVGHQSIQAIAETIGITDLLNKNTYHLSYGQKKRVAIAGVLVMEPEIIILDEPVAFLDPQTRQIIMEILEDFHQRGHTILITTHNIDFASEWAQDILLLQEGKILAQGNRNILLNEALAKKANIDMPIIAKVFGEAYDVTSDDIRHRALPMTHREAVTALQQLI